MTRRKNLFFIALLLSLSLSLFPSFVFAQASNNFPYLAQIISGQVNVRAGQNENFEKLGKLPQGGKVVVVGRSFSWDKIKLPVSCAAYVNQAFLQNMDDNLAMVKADHVNIRAGRGTNFSTIGTLKKGTLVKVLDWKEGWNKIEPVEGSFGWIQSQYLKFISKAIPPAQVVEPPQKKAPVSPVADTQVAVQENQVNATVPVTSSNP